MSENVTQQAATGIRNGEKADSHLGDVIGCILALISSIYSISTSNSDKIR